MGHQLHTSQWANASDTPKYTQTWTHNYSRGDRRAQKTGTAARRAGRSCWISIPFAFRSWDHTARGTRPGEEAAGGAVMAIRAPGVSPFTALQETATSIKKNTGFCGFNPQSCSVTRRKKPCLNLETSRPRGLWRALEGSGGLAALQSG